MRLWMLVQYVICRTELRSSEGVHVGILISLFCFDGTVVFISPRRLHPRT